MVRTKQPKADWIAGGRIDIAGGRIDGAQLFSQRDGSLYTDAQYRTLIEHASKSCTAAINALNQQTKREGRGKYYIGFDDEARFTGLKTKYEFYKPDGTLSHEEIINQDTVGSLDPDYLRECGITGIRISVFASYLEGGLNFMAPQPSKPAFQAVSDSVHLGPLSPGFFRLK